MPIPDTLKGVDDLIRADLEAFREIWFNRLLASTLLVVIGLALEGPELWYEISSIAQRWFFVRKFHFSSPEKHAPNWVKLVAFIGWLLIVAGVAGEYAADSFASKADGYVQKFDEILLADTTRQAGNAKASADAADIAARRARDESGKAVASASNALNLASSARQEADSFEKDIASAKKQAADAESHLADALERAANAEAELTRLKTPRSLIHSEDMIVALKPFNSSEYTLNVFMDDESIQFTKAVARALEEAGWVRKQPTNISLNVPTVEIVFDRGVAEYVPACVNTGISLRAHAKESLAVLQSLPLQSLPRTVQAAIALKSAIGPSISPPDARNVVSEILDPRPGEGPLTICVGKKP